MNIALLDDWVKDKNVSTEVSARLKESLKGLPEAEADKLIARISTEKMDLLPAMMIIQRQVRTANIGGGEYKPIAAGGEEKKDSGPKLSVPPAPPAKAEGEKKMSPYLPKFDPKKLKSDKKLSKNIWIIGGIVAILFLALLAAGISVLMKGDASNEIVTYEVGGQTAEGVGFPTAETPSIIPDPVLSSLPIEDKKEWASQVLENTLGDPALKRPASWSEVFENLPWMWLIYFFGAPILLFMVYRDRSQAQEQSDIKLANRGFWFMFLATILSEVISKAFVPMVFTNIDVGIFVILIIGLIGSVAFQWSAVTSGKRDFSVLAVGIFSTGLLIKWWLASNPILAAIATALMVVGMVMQLLEIGRNARDVDSEKVVVLNVIGVILMIVAFVVVFGFVFVTIHDAIGNTPIPMVDSPEYAVTAAKVELYSNGQMPISIALGVSAALIFGIFWGSLALKPAQSKDGKGRTTDGKIIGDVSLDADMMALFIMILWFLMPWMTWLPTFVLLFV